MTDHPALTSTLRKPRVLLAIVGAVVVVLIWALAYFLPEGSKLSTLKTMEATLQAKVNAGDATVARLKHTFQHSAQLLTLESKLKGAVPSTPDAFHYVSSLSAAAASAKVHLTSVTISSSLGSAGTSKSSASSTAALSSTAVTMIVKGSYDQLLSLITNIYSLNRLTDINSISVSGGGPATNRSTPLSATLSLQNFSASSGSTNP